MFVIVYVIGCAFLCVSVCLHRVGTHLGLPFGLGVSQTDMYNLTPRQLVGSVRGGDGRFARRGSYMDTRY